MQRSLESHSVRLESVNAEARLQLSDLSDKVEAQCAIIEQLKVCDKVGGFSRWVISDSTFVTTCGIHMR